MAKIGGFTKTRQYVRRQRALGRLSFPLSKRRNHHWTIHESVFPHTFSPVGNTAHGTRVRIKAVRKRTRRTKR